MRTDGLTVDGKPHGGARFVEEINKAADLINHPDWGKPKPFKLIYESGVESLHFGRAIDWLRYAKKANLLLPERIERLFIGQETFWEVFWTRKDGLL